MVKKSKKRLSSLGGSLKAHPFAYAMSIFGLLFTVWPLFLISSIRQYPECIAYDLFPLSNGYPEDVINSFIYFVQLPLAVVGVALIAIAVSYIARGRLNAKTFLWSFLSVAVIALIVHFILLIVGFTMSSDVCTNYLNRLPDFNLIIHHSQHL